MEDVLDLYQRAYDPHRPVLCLDELPVQLVGEVFTPLPTERGKPKREDYEYKRGAQRTCSWCLSRWRASVICALPSHGV